MVGTRKNSSVMMESVQPMGQIKYRKVRLGISGKMRYTQMNRMPHRKIMAETVGTMGRPIPLMAAQRTSLMPQIK